MPSRNVLWVSRHELWMPQKVILQAIHGKRVNIKKTNKRFENLREFLEFLDEKSEEFFVYAVIPEGWREIALTLGFEIGRIHRPYITKNKHGQRRRIFNVEFFCGENKTHQKSKVIPCRGNKGYVNRATC